jgi:hypothetical protein
VRPRLLGSQVPLAQSQKAPPPKMRVVVTHDVAPTVVAHPKRPADQRANDQCSCVRCSEYEPSIIEEEKSV